MDQSIDQSLSFSAHTQAVLREADASLLRLSGGSHHLLYQFLRVTAGRIARADSFYVGFYYEGNMMVFPYSFDGRSYYDPNKFAYRPDGLAAWVLRTQRPYWFRQDGGELFHKGKQFGQLDRRSEDTVAVPILEAEGRTRKRVLGIMSMQSYEPQTYTEESVRAMEWLARSLSIVLEREREDEARRATLLPQGEVIAEPMLRPDNVVNQMLEKMASIRRKGEAVRGLLASPGPDLTRAVEDLFEECERRQTETIEIFLQSVLAKNTPLSKLSGQERNVVALLVEGLANSQQGYTNSRLAESLGVTDETVRTHLKSIYRKLGVSGRTGVAALVRPYLPGFEG